MAYLIGIDVGTSACKVLLIDQKGKLLGSSTAEYTLQTPHPLWSEQNPEDWWQAAVIGIRQVLAHSKIDPQQIVGLGLTGQMHGLVLLDEKLQILRPAILWNDQRTGKQCKAITEQIGFDRLLQLTGNPILPGFTAPKILWVREHEPDVYQRIRYFLLPKDYLRFRLTGELATEVSDASGTSLFDVKQRTWSDEMFAALELPRSWAPACSESTEISGRVSQEAASATGLPAGLPVVGGGGDQAAQAIGVGLVEQGQVAVTIGTSGVVFAPTEQPFIEPEGRLHSFCHAIPGQWHVMGVMLAAGGSLQWYRDTLCQTEMDEAQLRVVDAYSLMMADADTAPAGCEGLLFLPYLSGERTPHPDPNARGVFFGLTLRHRKAHLTRAVVEGISFGLLDCLELVRTIGVEPDQIRASGGGARSSFWRQILADMFNTSVTTVNATEGAAFGAALLAGVGAKVYIDVPTACARTIQVTATSEPELEKVEIYIKYYTVYRQLYDSLKSDFSKLATLRT